MIARRPAGGLAVLGSDNVRSMRAPIVAGLLIAGCGQAKEAAPGGAGATGGSGSAVTGAPAGALAAGSGAASAPALPDAGVAPGPDDAPGAATADAAVEVVACTARAIADARKRAQVHLKAGAFDAALALLDGGTCFLSSDQEPALQLQIAWQISDLAFAQYKAGRPEACYATAASQLLPYIGNVGEVFSDDTQVMRALAYNAQLCQKAIDKQRGAFIAAPCALGIENAHGLPAQVLGPGAAACLVLEDGARAEEDLYACGKVVLVRKGGARTVLEVEEGNLADSSVCCNVTGVSFAKRPTGWAVLIETEGRDCNGGTAASEEQHVYELRGTTLELAHTVRAVAH